MRKSILTTLAALILSVFLIGSASAQKSGIMVFTPEQIQAMGDKIVEHNAAMQKIFSELKVVADELAMEAMKDSGDDVPGAQRKNPKKIEKLIIESIDLLGQKLKVKYNFLLSFKDILTPEQKKSLIRELEFKVDFFDNGSAFLFNLEDLDEMLDLTDEQIREIIKLRTDMLIRELKTKRKIAYNVLDIKKEIRAEKKDEGALENHLNKIADLGTKMMKNKVDYILTVRKVLTESQRQTFRQLMLMNIEALIPVQ